MRPLVPLDDGHSERASNDLDLEDVVGKRIIETRFARTVTIREENAVAALEVMTRFAVDPRWLIYLPPTMSPPATSRREGLLEHPEDAFSAYRIGGVEQVVCEEKHMGSRAVVVICRDPSVAATRFGIESEAGGSIFTRTGRPFFAESATEETFLEKVRSGIGRTGHWDELSTDWLILDCELLPWSAKAEEPLRRQYASVGAAATKAVREERTAIESTAARGVGIGDLVEVSNERVAMADGFVAAYRQYCWDVSGIEGLKLAPFQILAGEAEVHALKDHPWHLDVFGRLCATDPTAFRATRSLTVDVDDPQSVESGTQWWETLTSAGGEGMVVKPLHVIHRGPKGLVQPDIKCRGREYLRIIYGAEYTAERNLSRLRSRGLGLKRSLAQREFALGIEALERFTAGEPLYRIHECVFGVLALESEPVDPRL